MNEDKINFRRIFTLALKYWYLFALFLPLAVGGAYFYLNGCHGDACFGFPEVFREMLKIIESLE